MLWTRIGVAVADRYRLRYIHLGRSEVSYSPLRNLGRKLTSRYAYYNSKEGHHAMAQEGHH
jgi:hypothetical protein